MKELIDILRQENLSLLVIENSGRQLRFNGRGVTDLYHLLMNNEKPLNGSIVVDKVVGRGAAALMILGGVRRLHALLISDNAKELLDRSEVSYSYDTGTKMIINRDGTDICPVEKLTANANTPDECLPLISSFINKMKSKK